jgi:ABC-type phosphate transport system substrate-binding protein
MIKLKFRAISKQGFLVTLTHDWQQVEIEGFLPYYPAALPIAIEQWQSSYRQLEAVRLFISPQPGWRLTPKSSLVGSNWQYTTAVTNSLNQWLEHRHPDWQKIREALISLANRVEYKDTPIAIDTVDSILLRLPWQEWDLLHKYYPHTEIAFSYPKTGIHLHLQDNCLRERARILLVVGRSDGINTQADLEIVRELERVNAEVVCLIYPQLKDLCDTLWDERGYDIFIFTGHSGSEEDGQIGWIEINDRESLTIAQFKEGIKQAISRGLQLAIFNSCDGLGLANQLAQFNLPQIIVMREPVPDEVAITFLEYFFDEFTQDVSLFASLQKAKKRLEPFQGKYPGANWLPTLYFNWAITPLIWSKLWRKNTIEPVSNISYFAQKIGIFLLVGILSFSWGLLINFSPFQLATATSINPIESISQIHDFPAGIWQYAGSTTWRSIREIVDEKIKQKHPEFKLIYTPHPILPAGSGTGIKMLLDGQISFAQSSRSIREREYNLAAQRGVNLKQVPIAIDSIAVAVHPNLKVAGLTVKQLEDIYTGKIRNWKFLGGEDLEIVPYARSLGSGTTEFFQENILDNRSFAEQVIFLENELKMVENPGGIYFDSAAKLVGNCQLQVLPISRHKGSAFVSLYRDEWGAEEFCSQEGDRMNYQALQNGEYPLIRRLFIIIKQNGREDERVGEVYANILLTKESQQLIRKAGFLSIKLF